MAWVFQAPVKSCFSLLLQTNMASHLKFLEEKNHQSRLKLLFFRTVNLYANLRLSMEDSVHKSFRFYSNLIPKPPWLQRRGMLKKHQLWKPNSLGTPLVRPHHQHVDFVPVCDVTSSKKKKKTEGALLCCSNILGFIPNAMVHQE